MGDLYKRLSDLWMGLGSGNCLPIDYGFQFNYYFYLFFVFFSIFEKTARQLVWGTT